MVHDDGRVETINKEDYDSVKDLELSYLDSVKNVVKNVNPTIMDVIKMTSENPAKYINVYDKKGSISINKDADLLVIDNDYNLIDVFVGGIKQKIK